MIEPWTWLYQNLATILSAVSIIGTIIGMMWHLDVKIEKQGTRTDKLYELFIQQSQEFNKQFVEMRKESDQKFNDMRKESDQKFYDLLKEKK